jgi:hypothetical protein
MKNIYITIRHQNRRSLIKNGEYYSFNNITILKNNLEKHKNN